MIRFVLGILLATLTGSYVHAQQVNFLVSRILYPSLTGTILKGGQGGPVTPFLSTPAAPNDVDVFSGRLYWTEESTRTVRSATLEGLDVQTLFTSPLEPSGDLPIGMAINPTEGRVYWANLQSNRIRYVGLDGSNPGILPIPAGASPYALAVDDVNQLLYWTSSFEKRIYRTDLATQTSEVVLTDSANLPSMFGLALDPQDGKIYWTDRDVPSIRRANVDGANIETVVTGETGTFFRDIQIDVA
jgi:DNA-binding beta-propeller fold protein YncE